MELDTKQKVLIALYTEYQKDLPDMKSINAETLGLSKEVFFVAIMKLKTEGYITDLIELKVAGMLHPLYRLDNMKLTRDGLEYVETKLDINSKATGKEKVIAVSKKLGEWGMDTLKDVVGKIAAELIKGSF